jgi:heme O synthase-like polyprenyltransferase
VESPLLSILALVALVLLVVVTGGVGYLTLANWRDRRLQEQEKREQRRPVSKRKEK